jgi:hypothetical protein
MVISTGNIGSKLATGELFADAEVLQVMKVLWEEVITLLGGLAACPYNRK